MDFSIATILAQDGITTGAIYALLALALVLVFSVTRVIFIPQGEYVTYGALTMAAMQANKFPLAASLLVALGLVTFLLDAWQTLRSSELRPRAARLIGVSLLKFVLVPVLVWLTAQVWGNSQLSMPLQILLTLAIVVPLGPMVYRIAFQPIAEASTLVLLIVAVAVHITMLGLGLLMFGAEGWRTAPLTDLDYKVAGLSISGQTIAIVTASLLLIVALYFYFDRTLSGKALRATSVNRLGARLVGIGTSLAGRLAFTLAAAMGALCGILIAPLTALYYDSGFLIGLKGFVGAIIGGLASYPIAAAGSLLVGLLEAYSSFWASSLKEVIVFTLIIPVLLWRSLTTHHTEDEAEE